MSVTEIDTRTLLRRTKFHRPTLAEDLIAREELLARLDSGARLPLALVCAPAGYGKSTLLGHWLERRDRPSAWLSLDRDDNDLGAFAAYLVAAVRTCFPSACEGTQASL